MSDSRLKKYCFDSSVFINSWRRYYPITIFPSLWDKLSELIIDGRVIVTKEAEKEILVGKDDLALWFKKKIICVVPFTEQQFIIVSEIVNRYPKTSQFNKPKPNHADPFIVALAKIENAIVVTDEVSNGGNNDNPKIPNLCYEYGVECFSLVDLFKGENWEF